MAKTILFTFDDDVKRDKFLALVKALAASINNIDLKPVLATKDDSVLLTNTLDTVRLDPPIKTNSERAAALFVSGKKLAEGQLSDIQRRFDQEAVSHSASIEIRELREGEWKTIRSRKLQK